VCHVVVVAGAVVVVDECQVVVVVCHVVVVHGALLAPAERAGRATTPTVDNSSTTAEITVSIKVIPLREVELRLWV
jgi:hypothetical protein